MRFLHTMLRVKDLDESLRFWTEHFGMKLLRRRDYPEGKFTLAFVGYGDESEHTVLELTHNWGKSDYVLGDQFGHVAIGVDDIYGVCERLRGAGVQRHARAGTDEARQHRDRVRRGSERLQDRADPGSARSRDPYGPHAAPSSSRRPAREEAHRLGHQLALERLHARARASRACRRRAPALLRCSMIGPWSYSSSTKCTVAPVSFTPAASTASCTRWP